MLLRAQARDAIDEGRISLALRRWKRPTGGRPALERMPEDRA